MGGVGIPISRTLCLRPQASNLSRTSFKEGTEAIDPGLSTEMAAATLASVKAFSTRVK